MPDVGGIDRIGVFYSQATKEDLTTTIQTIILHKDESIVHIRPDQRTVTANAGESVTLRMQSVNAPNANYRWKHDEAVVDAWNNQLTVTIQSVATGDGGIYSCFVAGQESERLHGIMRLIVRGCSDGKWGPPSCLNICRQCYNGGVCDDVTGRCVCSPGFSGTNCELVHGRNVFGINAGQTCSGDDPHSNGCQGHFFCQLDPYGCSCAAGYSGLDCMEECAEGMYGADCTQSCHCATGVACLKDTGECAGACDSTYFGSNCQCSTRNGLQGLQVISGYSDTLYAAWPLEPCATGYRLQYELTNPGQCGAILPPQRVTIGPDIDLTNGYYFISGLMIRSTYTVYVRPVYDGGVEGPEVSASGITFGEREDLTVTLSSDDPFSITISWMAEFCADHYIVEHALRNKEGCETIEPVAYVQHCMCEGTASTTTISGLNANSVYSIKVTGGVTGSVIPITTAGFTTSTSAPTVPPMQVTLTSREKRSLSFSWGKPPCGGRGGIITGHTYKLTQTGLVIIHQSTTTNEAVTIDDLIPFSAYNFQVAASTSGGDGPFSESVMNATLEAEPTVPLNVMKTNVDDVSITLQWSDPDPPQGIITSYSIRYGKLGSDTMKIVDGVTQLTYRIMNLQTNTVYLVEVQARTSIGPGPWSEAIVGTPKIGAPGPVLHLRFRDITDKLLALEWDPPTNPNGQITHYNVVYREVERPYQEGFAVTNDYMKTEVQVSAFEKTDLEPGTKYEFGISAQNQLFNGIVSSLAAFTKPLKDIPKPISPSVFSEDTTDTTVTIGLSGIDSKYIISYIIKVEQQTSQAKKREVLVAKHHRDSSSDYIAAEIPKADVARRFVVGDSLIYGGYYNAPLQKGNSYEISIGAVSKTNATEANVAFSDSLNVTVQKDVSSNVPLIAAVSVLGFIVIIVVSAFILLWRKRNRDNVLPGSHGFAEEMVLPKIPSGTLNESPNRRASDDVYEDIGLPVWAKKWEITWKNLFLEDKILGKGNFGEVLEGGVKIKGIFTKAAVKKLKAGASQAATEDFMREFQTMTKMDKHPNIVGLLGACFYNGILYVALEYLSKGNLRDYLRVIRPKQMQGLRVKGGSSPMTISRLLKFGEDVAKGMAHLSDAGIIHRDLAARNILLGEDLVAKVADFGLSRGEDIYVQESMTRIPTRWLAIESLTRKTYLSKSDVWSFGILLWEIASFGGTPYPGIESRSLVGQLLNGYRMAKPENCPDEIYEMMLLCWQKEISQRPSFNELVQSLERINDVPKEHVFNSTPIYDNFSVIKPEFDDR